MVVFSKLYSRYFTVMHSRTTGLVQKRDFASVFFTEPNATQQFIMFIGATIVGTGGDWWPTMYWSSNFLAVVFKKQEISQQVVTRMQDLASEFSKIFRGWYPRTLPHPTPSRPLAGRGVGTQTLVPSTFQPWLDPWLYCLHGTRKCGTDSLS